MPALSTKAPAEETYKYVLQQARFIAVPGKTHPIRLSAYRESCESIATPCLIRDETFHRLRHTVFVRHKDTAERYTKLGWVDVTGRWRARLAMERPLLGCDSQVKLYRALSDDYKSKNDLVQAAGIADSKWRTAIRVLLDKGVAEVKHSKRRGSGARNKTFRYKKGPTWGKVRVKEEE